jgi:hypothetical protein
MPRSMTRLSISQRHALLLYESFTVSSDSPPTQTGSPAIFDYGANGPCFGADALKIPLGLAPQMARSRCIRCVTLPLLTIIFQGSSYAGVVGSSNLGKRDAAGSRGARSRLGSHYERLGNGGRSLFTEKEGMDAQLAELRVYTSPGREGAWPAP